VRSSWEDSDGDSESELDDEAEE
jgi:hypothetical protein